MEGDITVIRMETQFGQILALSNFCYLALTDNPTWDDRIIDVWIDSVLPYYVAMLSPGAEVTQFEIHPINYEHSGSVFRDVVPPQVGGYGSDPAPGQVAAKVSWYPDGSHRSQRGRTFIGGLAGDSIENSRRITGGFYDLCAAWAEQMMYQWGPDGVEGTARFSILSRFLDGSTRADPVALPVMEWNVPSIIGTQPDLFRVSSNHFPYSRTKGSKSCMGES